MGWSPYRVGTFKGLSAEQCHQECVKNAECVEFALGNDFGGAKKFLGDCALYRPGCEFTYNPAYDHYISTMLPSQEPDVCTFTMETKGDAIKRSTCIGYGTGESAC